MPQLTAEGLAQIKAHEGLRLDAYPDAGYGWARGTIGYGHTSQAGPPMVTRGMRITADEAEAILISDLRKFETAVRSAVHVPLNDNQFSALVSFTFNLGSGNLQRSTLLRKLNMGDYAGAADQFLVWNKSNGKVLPGLKRRREAERALFLKPVMANPAAPAVTPTKPATKAPATAIGILIAAIIAAFAFLKG